MPARWKRPSVRLSLRQRPLALQHVDVHRGLVVGRRAEDLALPGGDGRVARDQDRHDAAQGLDAERQRRHVEEHDVLDVAREHAALDGGADGDDLVGVHALVGLLAEELLDQLLDLRHPRLAADEDDLVDVGRGDAGVLHGLAAGLDGALDEVGHQRLELGPGERHHQVLGARLRRR